MYMKDKVINKLELRTDFQYQDQMICLTCFWAKKNFPMID